jgi:hypothetical protein
MKVKVSDLHPNPFRHMDRYPIRREKVDALRESLRKTGFWDNVVARQQDGRVEIAYGHHRLVALQEEYGPEQEVNVILRDLDDTKMLQIMANENMEEWGNSVWVEMETVAAVIEAYDAGQIELKAPYQGPASGQFRTASNLPYSAQTIADFLGWHQKDKDGQVTGPSYKVATAINALDLIRQGVLTDADFVDLGTTQAMALVEQTRRALGEREARRLQKQAEEQRKAAEAAARERARAEAEQERQQKAALRAQDEAARAEANRKRLAAQRVAAVQRPALAAAPGRSGGQSPGHRRSLRGGGAAVPGRRRRGGGHRGRPAPTRAHRIGGRHGA